MDVLLLSGYRPKDPIALHRSPQDEIWLDFQIASLQSLGLTPIVVLAGPHADSQIGHSRRLETCGLVYDDHKEANLYTNLLSGLRVAESACFFMPVEVPIPPMAAWKRLKGALVEQGFATDRHLFQLVGGQGAPWHRPMPLHRPLPLHYGFPLLLTESGRRFLLKLENGAGLTDPRLRYQFLPAELAPEGVSL